MVLLGEAKEAPESRTVEPEEVCHWGDFELTTLSISGLLSLIRVYGT